LRRCLAPQPRARCRCDGGRGARSTPHRASRWEAHRSGGFALPRPRRVLDDRRQVLARPRPFAPAAAALYPVARAEGRARHRQCDLARPSDPYSRTHHDRAIGERAQAAAAPGGYGAGVAERARQRRLRRGQSGQLDGALPCRRASGNGDDGMVPRLLIALMLLTAPALADHVPLTKGERNLDTAAGWALFKRPWISSPSSLEAGGGLGPLYDARSCNECHAGGGAGTVAEDAIGAGMVVRVGNEGGAGDATYGHQLQTHALPGFASEADISFLWNIENGLRTPKLGTPAFHYGAPEAATHFALRRAPSLFGIGALERVPDSEILKGSGKPAWLVGADGKRELGRWGWKATASGLPRQVENAFQRDFGIATSDLPGAAGECTAHETPAD